MSAASRILVVEDEVLLLEIVCEWLAFEGYTIYAAQNGSEALRVVDTHPVDVALTDVRMPGMDGLTLLRELRRRPGPPPAQILMSGYTEITPREAFDLGVQVALSKPFTDQQMLSAVSRAVTPRTELWSKPAPDLRFQDLEASFDHPEGAREGGELLFGRGGFCIRTAAALKAGPVRFRLSFEQDGRRLEGTGMVRWVEPGEEQVGIEITTLDPRSLAAGVALSSGSDEKAYIPRSTRCLVAG